jgi:hypothetical protein
MKTTPSPMAPTCVVATASVADAGGGDAGGDAGAVVGAITALGGGGVAGNGVCVIDDGADDDGVCVIADVDDEGAGDGGDGFVFVEEDGGAFAFGAAASSGITSLGEVGHGTGSLLSCAHATRAAARCRETTTPIPTRTPTRAPGSPRFTG